jgi:hypothetical protein
MDLASCHTVWIGGANVAVESASESGDVEQVAEIVTLGLGRNLKCAIPSDWNTGSQGFASSGFASSATTAASNFE